MYVQLEFDFTFDCFCKIVDDFSGEVVCGSREECFFDPVTCRYYPTSDALEEHAMYDCTPFCNVVCKKPKINYAKYRIHRQKKISFELLMLQMENSYRMMSRSDRGTLQALSGDGSIFGF